MMSNRNIFEVLPPEKLMEIGRYLEFNPRVNERMFSELAADRQAAWLDAHRRDLLDHFRWVGSSFLGKLKTYREVVLDTAGKIGASASASRTTPEVERAIVAKVWTDAMARMSEQQRAELNAAIEEFASRNGKKFGRELSGLAALGAAQLSGFGVYVLGSTLLGAVNGALGLGLGFGAFTGLSSLISVAIGPLGWAVLGVLTVFKLGGPNYKKVLPAILVIATCRAENQQLCRPE